jgi:hypothetical protein
MIQAPPPKHAEFWARLFAPFRPEEVKPLNKAGKVFHYVTPRTIMNRFDEVCGPSGWQTFYEETKDGMICRIQVKDPDGNWTHKSDGGGYSDMQNDDDTEKTAFSSSFKRAAVMLGLGRYLYQDGVPSWVRDTLIKLGYSLSDPPAARPAQAANAAPQQQQRQQYDGPPASGRGLFAWAKTKNDQEIQNGSARDWVSAINDVGAAKGFPRKMIDWTPEQVKIAYEAVIGT